MRHMAKPHILLSDEHLIAGRDYESLCHRQILRAQWRDDEEIDWNRRAGELVSMLGVCTSCRKAYESMQPAQAMQLMYFATPGEELMEVSE